MSGNDVIIGVGWYKKSDWLRIRELSEDKEEMHDCYEDWKQTAKEEMKRMQQQGCKTRKVSVTAVEFFLWCEKQDRPVNGESRSEYITRKLKQLL